MMTYELMYIIPATSTEEEVGKLKDEVSALVAKHGTESLRDESFGKRKLAYPIRGIRYGYYVLVCFTAEASNVAALDEELRHDARVLRHMIVKALPGAEKAEVALPEYEIPEMGRRRKPGTSSDAPARTKKTEAEVEKAVEETKEVTEEALAKKIDEILESDTEKL
ncbi:30S ribosomal protein S6 [Candidatus Uhrbacteria bacterium CG10_big_fil_rev_8_21_14_0_10_50_16]|uniref:Small ribosomal subunit protein bS6 n=1 Tax=Candidatus Uhrbacteria bacterium CG10_big_fil_rev_8_21_14_0_10_50_16 TaxID=1975039 RepID=A0A2H0RPS7_9BACT|nr:MAG: 30S ribosomal protein S6 [Candidatus Uhrbacteria bacterium CG10_big_fil_rev_8_21_14_0_10_50_16]